MALTLLEVIKQLPEATQNMPVDAAMLIISHAGKGDVGVLRYNTEKEVAINLMARLIESNLEENFTTVKIPPMEKQN